MRRSYGRTDCQKSPISRSASPRATPQLIRFDFVVRLLVLGYANVGGITVQTVTPSLVISPRSSLVGQVDNFMRVWALCDQQHVAVFARNPNLRKQMRIPDYVEYQMCVLVGRMNFCGHPG